MAFREIVGSVVTGFLLIFFFWFVFPVARTAYTAELKVVNQTTPLMQTILPFYNNWWLVFPFIIAISGGWTIYQYMSDKEGFDY